MGAYPTINFGSSERGLFTPEEIRRLMESEYQRSLRYDYPQALLLVEIDRLESLHDLYGVESEQRIVRAVGSLLRSSTRESDVMGVQRDQRLLVLLPHTRREGASAIARRLLSGCRELEFRGDGRVLRASLSIGVATRAGEGGLAALTARAEEALHVALSAGGDRFVEYEALPRSAAPPAATPARVQLPGAVPARARAAPGPILPRIEEIPGTTLEEKALRLLSLAGGPAGAGTLDQEVLSILQRTLAEARRPRGSREDVLREIRALEQRVAQFKQLLDASEEELARLVREKSLDPGVASIYRSVRGLDPGERDYARKRELLGLIYQANVELLRELEGEAGRGSP